MHGYKKGKGSHQRFFPRAEEEEKCLVCRALGQVTWARQALKGPCPGGLVPQDDDLLGLLRDLTPESGTFLQQLTIYIVQVEVIHTREGQAGDMGRHVRGKGLDMRPLSLTRSLQTLAPRRQAPPPSPHTYTHMPHPDPSTCACSHVHR